MTEILDQTCFIRKLPEVETLTAAQDAVAENPVNAPLIEMLPMLVGDSDAALTPPTPMQLAVMTQRYWGSQGKILTVQFLDNPSAECKRLILAAAGEWSKYCNIKFVESNQGIIRVLRDPREGLWSYLGTDALRVPANQHTMNLGGFTESTPWEEYTRGGTHEFGHSIGCAHEHLRRTIIQRIDRQKAYDFFRQRAGWDEQTTTVNVLRPIEERFALMTPLSDENSVMCYALPGEIMIDCIPVRGGTQLSDTDKTFIAQVYPLPSTPQPPITPRRLLRIELPFSGDVKDVKITSIQEG